MAKSVNNIFRKEVKVVNNKKAFLPACVTGSDNIAPLWKKYHRDIFKCVRSNNSYLDYGLSDGGVNVKSDEVHVVDEKLTLNSACGPNQIRRISDIFRRVY